VNLQVNLNKSEPTNKHAITTAYKHNTGQTTMNNSFISSVFPSETPPQRQCSTCLCSVSPAPLGSHPTALWSDQSRRHTWLPDRESCSASRSLRTLALGDICPTFIHTQWAGRMGTSAWQQCHRYQGDSIVGMVLSKILNETVAILCRSCTVDVMRIPL